MGKKLEFDTGVSTDIFDAVIDKLIQTTDKVEVLQHEIDDVKNHKAKIEVDDNGLKIGKKSVERFKEEISNKKLSRVEFFDDKDVKKSIDDMVGTLDKAYDKIYKDGQKLTANETDEFIKMFAKLREISNIAGKDFGEKYNELWNSLYNSIKTGMWENSPFEFMNKDYFNSLLKPIVGIFGDEWKNLFKDKIFDDMAQKAYQVNEAQRQQIRETSDQLAEAEGRKREELRKTQSEVQGMLDQFNAMRGEDEVFNIDLTKFGEIQQAFRTLIQLLQEANIDTTKLEDSFALFSSGVVVPKDQIDNAKHSVEELRKEIEYLQDELRQRPSQMSYDLLLEKYEKTKSEVEDLTKSVEILQDRLYHTRDEDEFENLSEDVDFFKSHLEEAKIELINVKDELAKVREEKEKIEQENERLREVREDMFQEEESISKTATTKFSSTNLKNFIGLLSQIENHLKEIRTAFGSVDDNSGFKNIIDSISILLEKLSEMQGKIDSGIFNVTVNKTGVTAADTIVNEELERMMNKYNEFVSIFGGESNLFNTLTSYGGTGIDFEKYYSSNALKDIVDPLQKVNRLQDFFRDIEIALRDISSFKKVLREDAKELRSQIKELEENKDAYDFFNSDNDQSMAKDAISQAKNRLKSINALLKMLRNAEKFEAPDSSAEELSQKIKNENVNLLEDEDLEGLDKIIQQLERISELLSEISKKDLFGESFSTLTKQLDDLIGKFSVVIETIQATKTASGATTVATSDNNVEALIASEEKAQKAIEDTNSAIEKQATESTQLSAQVSQIDSLAESNKDLYINANNVTNVTTQLEKKVGIFQKIFEWAGKVKDKIRDIFNISSPEEKIARYQNQIDVLTNKISEMNQGIANKTVSTSQDSIQEELVETTQKAEEATEAIKQEEEVINTITPLTVSTSEVESINAVKDALDVVIEYIQRKNQMFEQEGQIVAGVTQSEITELTILLGWLSHITTEIKAIGDAFSKNLSYTPNIDIESLDKFITKVKNLKPDKIGLNLTSVYDWIDDFSKAINQIKLDPKSFLSSIDSILDKGEELKAIATIIKASKKDIDKAKTAVNTNNPKSESSQLQEYINLTKKRLDLEIQLEKAKKNNYENKEVQNLESRIKAYKTQEESEKNILDSEEKRLKYQEAIADKELQLAKVKEDSARKQERDQENIARQEESNYSKQASLLKQINTWVSKNSKAYKAYKDDIDVLINRLSSGAKLTDEELKSIKNSFNEIDNAATVAGKKGISIVDMIKNRWKSLIAYSASFLSFYRVAGYIRQAISTITDLDTQLVDLRKTTTMNTTELNNFYQSSSDVAKQLGVTTSEIISQAAAWSRLGYSSNEAATEMAKLSSKFASVSPGMTTENATDYLVSTMQAYGIAVDEVERKIMDNVNKIGNTFATTNAEIGEMLTRSSAAMKAANNTLEETIALESAAVQITRNAETTGTAFRTVSMRIRGKQLMPPYSENCMLCA